MPRITRHPLSLLDLPGELQAKIEKAARRNRRTPIEELVDRVQGSFAVTMPSVMSTTELGQDASEPRLQSYT